MDQIAPPPNATAEPTSRDRFMPLRRSVIIPARHSPIYAPKTDTVYEIATKVQSKVPIRFIVITLLLVC
jgi:hypothetical protein